MTYKLMVITKLTEPKSGVHTNTEIISFDHIMDANIAYNNILADYPISLNGGVFALHVTRLYSVRVAVSEEE